MAQRLWLDSSMLPVLRSFVFFVRQTQHCSLLSLVASIKASLVASRWAFIPIGLWGDEMKPAIYWAFGLIFSFAGRLEDVAPKCYPTLSSHSRLTFPIAQSQVFWRRGQVLVQKPLIYYSCTAWIVCDWVLAVNIDGVCKCPLCSAIEHLDMSRIEKTLVWNRGVMVVLNTELDRPIVHLTLPTRICSPQVSKPGGSYSETKHRSKFFTFFTVAQHLSIHKCSPIDWYINIFLHSKQWACTIILMLDVRSLSKCLP